MRRALKSALATALTLALVLAFVYAALCWLFWVYEPAFVFRRLPHPGIGPEAAGLQGASEVTVTAEDGTRLYGWWRPPAPGHGAVVLLTGTGVTLAAYGSLISDLAADGMGVLGIDYRGNGGSPGIPSEAGWRADARAAFDYVRAAAPQAKIAAMGQSMGAGFAVFLALDRPVVGVLLDSPYASVARLFERSGLPFLRLPFPARPLMTDPIDAEAVIGRLRVPVLMIHGTEDSAIPLAEARRLYAAAVEPKELIEVEGGYHAGVWHGPYRERGLTALAAWTAP